MSAMDGWTTTCSPCLAADLDDDGSRRRRLDALVVTVGEELLTAQRGVEELAFLLAVRQRGIAQGLKILDVNAPPPKQRK